MTYEEYRAAVLSRVKEIYPCEIIEAVGYIGQAFSGHVSVEDAAKQIACDSDSCNEQTQGT